jgi:hypothetical protein
VEALARHGVTRFSATGQAGSLPTMAIVGFVKFRDILTTEEQTRLWDSHRHGTVPLYHEDVERAMGDYTPGRFVWRSSKFVSVNDLAISGVRGRQRIWKAGETELGPIRRRIRDYGLNIPGDLFIAMTRSWPQS